MRIGAVTVVGGDKIAKSSGNGLRLDSLEKENLSPLDLRYFFLTATYRTQQNFTTEAVTASKNARLKLKHCLPSKLHC
jgi:cysteinyl-tRNA synthetase